MRDAAFARRVTPPAVFLGTGIVDILAPAFRATNVAHRNALWPWLARIPDFHHFCIAAIAANNADLSHFTTSEASTPPWFDILHMAEGIPKLYNIQQNCVA